MEHNYFLEVRGYELDSFGHVNNSVYLNYLEDARWNFFKDAKWMDYFKDNKLFPVIIETNVRYIHELKIFDRIQIKTEWKYEGQYLLNNQIIYMRDSNIKVVKAITKIILVSKERIVYELPDFIKRELDGNE